jgi:MFS family permease
VRDDSGDASKPASSSLWRPLQIQVFRNLLLANVVSDMGAFMQSVGAAWLMVSLHAGPIYVALTQTASSLPFFLLALPAGSAGDILDRRKLILATESWMAAMALLIVILTMGGLMTPWLLLVLTSALSAGDAFETPSWRALLPELVPKEELANASALNGIEFNLARAVGPALAGLIIAVAGVATAFLVNFVSFSESSWWLRGGRGQSASAPRRGNRCLELPSPRFAMSATHPKFSRWWFEQA